MCGIAGFSGAGSIQILTSMTDVLSSRGPDDSGIFHDPSNNIFLGHRRLSIVDIAGGHQPMMHRDGNTYVIFNGEIYNHQELRNELVEKGHVFFSDHSDTEVLIHGYREWGSSLPARLNGMFAFAIYDKLNQIFFLARDRFGEKPLYFSLLQAGIVFASELKAVIKHPLCPRTISKEGMKKFFAYGFIPAPDTILSSVKKLMPGHHLTYNLRNHSHCINSFWNFNLKSDKTTSSDLSDLKIQLKNLVHQAVERRLMSDVPVGVFLSGGVDSSIILSSVSKFKDPSSIDTFSIGFNEESFDESSYAREVSSFFGTKHHEKFLSVDDAKNILDNVLNKIDEPLGDPSILPTYLLAKFASDHVKVALGGDGADELFAGYDPFKALKPASLYSKMMPKSLHHCLLNAVNKIKPSEKNMSLDFRIKRTLRALSYDQNIWNPVWLGPLDPDSLAKLFGENIDICDTYSESLHDWISHPNYNLTEHTLSFYTNLYLPNNILTKVDRASMMVSLEARAPFLDNDLVSFVENLETNLKFDGKTTKFLLKETFKDDVPESVTKRPKKGFGIPLGAWLKTWDDSSFIDNLPYIDQQWLKSKWVEHQNNVFDHRQLLWCAISLSRFLRSLEKI